MNNAEWMIKSGYKFSDLLVSEAEKGKHGFRICIATSDGTCKKIGETEHVYNNRLASVILWLDEEHKESILDDAEKRYLSTVIGPVKNNVYAIRKVCSAYEDREFIAILGFFGGNNCTFLPNFEPGTMFKGMEPDRWYSLEELGL